MIDFLIRNSGWIGICLGQFVPWFQIIKIYKSKKSSDVSIGTYIFLVAALFFYLTHAIDIRDPAFIVAQALALTSNAIALFLIIKHK